MPKYNLLYEQEISIHALRVEGDTTQNCLKFELMPHFYPRPPGGGRLFCPFKLFCYNRISIHALRVEGDLCDKKTEQNCQ